MSSDTCPSESRLLEFLRGEGDRDTVKGIAKHLEECTACSDRWRIFQTQFDTLGRSSRPFDSLSMNMPDSTLGGPIREETLADTNIHRSEDDSIASARRHWLQDTATHGDSPRAPRATPSPGESLEPETIVRYFGDYEIRKFLGRGAMGVVYRARQVSLNRSVAIKMVKVGILADDAALRRFQNEAEAVALLDHPCIVPVYEVGDHEGQRYYSMKLIEGGNLAEQLARFRDRFKAVARFMAEVAEGVHHAHMRGILHRDLKPANILVDQEGHPHITDFGLAKKIEADIEMTATGVILGTPAYMSPEQAASQRGAITTAADVYGLGAVLYALLTGRAPFGGRSLIETLDSVKNKLPEPPSKVNPKVPRDLETISLKCLEKDSRRRYSSAQELANDLGNWLESRPISARRVGTAERGWLWCKRRPTVAALTAGFMLSVVGGTGAVIAVQARSNADLRSANYRVQERFKLASRAIRSFSAGVAEDEMLKRVELRELRNKLLDSAAKFHGELKGLLLSATDRDSRVELARSYAELGDLTSKIGVQSDALKLHRTALEIRRALATRPDAESRLDLARSLIKCGVHANATNDPAGALVAFEEARDLAASMASGPAASSEARELVGDSYHMIATLLSDRGERVEALKSYGKALEIRGILAEEQPDNGRIRNDQAMTWHNIGYEQMRMSQPRAALESYEKALLINEGLVEGYPAVVEYRTTRARLLSSIGTAQWELDAPDLSLEALRQALMIWEKLAAAFPAFSEYRAGQGGALINLGIFQAQSDQEDKAILSLRQAVRVWEKLSEENPAVIRYSDEQAKALTNIGALLRQIGQTPEALQACHQAASIRKALVQSNKTNIEFITSLGVSMNNVAAMQFLNKDHLGAVASYREAVEIREKLVQGFPSNPGPKAQLAYTRTSAADVLRWLGQLDEARDNYLRAIELREWLFEADSHSPRSRGELAASVRRLGLNRAAAGDIAGAVADSRRALSLYEGLPSPSSLEWFEQACAHATIAKLAGVDGSGIAAYEARIEVERTIDLFGKAVEMGFQDFESLKTETDLEPLRSREDFQLLLLDMAMPDDVFGT